MAEKKEKAERAWKRRIPEEARQHAQAAHKEMRQSIAALLPPEFVASRRKARKEMLLAIRSLVDGAIERLETRQE